MDAHANLAYSTVAGAPSPATTGTSLTVSSGHGARFPAVPFNAVVWPTGAIPTPANAEIVRVTNRVSDVLTITRAQESSSARTIIVGDQIAAAITAKTLTDIEAALVTDHGDLDGLADDDHTQYLKERASGGLEAEVPGHTHVSTATAGVIAFVQETIALTDASGDWTVPAGFVSGEAELIGPGGGGGGADNDNAAGGGGGAGSRSLWAFVDADVGATVAYTIPAGGAGGAVGSNGSNGAGSVTFGGVSANPGSGGEASTSTVPGKGGLGGTVGAGGDLHVPGAPGQSGMGDAIGDTVGGAGGSSPYGGGGRGGRDDEAGEDATGYGSGGGGGAEDDGTGQAGGAGKAGLIVLRILKRVTS